MKRGIGITMISAILALSSCTKERVSGHGSVTTESRNISGFTNVSTAGSTNIYISPGAAFKVEVKGYSNLLPYYETKLVNNTLQLGFKEGVNVKNDNTEVFITMPSLNGISLAGSGNISTSGIFPNVTDFNSRIEGSGNIDFSNGTCSNFYATIEGSGNIKAMNMVADKAETNTTGSGNTEITANTQLKVRITGSGNVYYRGTPVITTNIAGSGAVIPR
ncbi:MAG TPA: head GIN domain-containing protein [Chitinophagaceae bacterium]|nr:head GIN domain-containing protein [Chitinophagaceae bacterium]